MSLQPESKLQRILGPLGFGHCITWPAMADPRVYATADLLFGLRDLSVGVECFCGCLGFSHVHMTRQVIVMGHTSTSVPPT